MPQIASLDHLVLTVADMDATVRFYTAALGMTVEVFHPADGTRRMALRFGVQKLNLHQVGAEFEPKACLPTPGSADLCFVTEVPLAHWQKHLGALDIPILLGPVPRTGALGPMTSLYIRDPDQNLIEIAQYA